MTNRGRRRSRRSPGGRSDDLAELALNLRWAWHHGTDERWAALDPELWALTHNPWVVLQTVSRSKLRRLLARPESRAQITRLLDQRRVSLSSSAWFQQRHGGLNLSELDG